MVTGINGHDIASRQMSGEIAAPGAGQSEGRGSSATESAKLDQAAREFEALLLTEVLKSARQPGEGGWLTSGSDEASNTALELAESQLARVLASRGILGVDKLLADDLERRGEQAAAIESAPSASLDLRGEPGP